jgi:hypothetical protein
VHGVLLVWEYASLITDGDIRTINFLHIPWLV